MSALRELYAIFGVKVDSSQLDRADTAIDGLWGKLKAFAPALAGGAIGAGLMKFAGHVSDIGDQLDKASIRTGVSTDTLQALAHAADASGTSAETLTNALLQLQDRVGDALTNATGENAKAFGKLGISLRDASGEAKGADELFDDIADRLGKMKSPAEKTTAVMNLFGRAGKELLPMLGEGREGLEKLRREFVQLGGGFSKQAVKVSRDYNDALGRGKTVVKGFQGAIAERLLPVMTKLVDWVVKASATFLEWVKSSSAIETALGALGLVMAALAVKTAIAMAPTLAIVGALALLFLVVEDIVTLMRGGKSVIGDFIDAHAGAGSAKEIVQGLKEAWDAVTSAITQSSGAAKVLIEYYKTLAKWSPVGIMIRTAGKAGDLAAQVVNAGKENLSALGIDGGTSDGAKNIVRRRMALAGGMANFGGEGFMEAQTATAVARAGTGDMLMPSTNVTVNVNGGNPEEVRRVVVEALNTETKKAHGAVAKHTERRR